MIHAKIRKMDPLVSRDYHMVLPIHGHGGHLGYVTCMFYIHILPTFLEILHIKSRFDWPIGIREKDLWWKTTEDGYLSVL